MDAGTIDILNITRKKIALKEKKIKLHEKYSATLRFIHLAVRKKIVQVNRGVGLDDPQRSLPAPHIL